LRAELGRYEGVKDITDSFRSGKQEIQLRLLPAARNFGITQADLGRQVRQAFYGEEVQRIPRESEDVRAMVRFPESDRESIGNLEDMRVRTPDGTEVPLTSVAEYKLGRGYSSIERDDGQRVVTVKADVDSSVITSQEVLDGVLAESMPQILEKYPTVSYAVAGEAEERFKSMDSLLQGFMVALIVIYGLLAVPLRSYIQPLVIMSVIPFGAVGAMLGHYILGAPLVFPSILGMVALSGVVVNASLVLLDYINKQRIKGASALEAVSTAGIVRFRPIWPFLCPWRFPSLGVSSLRRLLPSSWCRVCISLPRTSSHGMGSRIAKKSLVISRAIEMRICRRHNASAATSIGAL
jgi:multidrug efflux pump subunit AcrB